MPLCPAPTARLRLRPFEARDVDALQAMHRDPRVRALLVDDHPLDDAAVARAFVHGLRRLQAQDPGLGIWHAQRRQAGDPAAWAEARAAVAAGDVDASALHWLAEAEWSFCGWFNLMRMPHDAARVEIGCRLLPSAWGSGLALEGGEALLVHAFEALGLETVWAVCHERHRSVHALLLALGFAPQGVQRYDGVARAAYFAMERGRWQHSRLQPLRQRRRDAVHALAAHAGLASGHS